MEIAKTIFAILGVSVFAVTAGLFVVLTTYFWINEEPEKPATPTKPIFDPGNSGPGLD